METVLIVDDEAATRDILVELLHKDGGEIVTGGDGHQALERLTEIPRPCLIVLDLMMPEWTAENFCACNRQIGRLPIFLQSFCPAPPAPPAQGTSCPNLSTLTDYWLWLISIADFGVAPAFGESALRPIYARASEFQRLLVAMVAEQPLQYTASKPSSFEKL